MRSWLHRLSLTTIILSVVCPAPAVAASTECEPQVATIVSVQGSVEVRRAGEWQAASLNERVCAGDTIRVQEQSRAAIALVNETILRLDQNTIVTFPEPEKTPEGTKLSLRDLLRGAIHFFSRAPRTLEVNTPFVNAAVEGTEFLITVGEDRATLTVLAGKVKAFNDEGSVFLKSGESTTVKCAEPPVDHVCEKQEVPPKPTVLVRARDAIRWTLYYPP
ncbi:MAG: FecR domain-containing protein, partial [Gammaproteobacteria bacterium]